jgi:hypothetical protein
LREADVAVDLTYDPRRSAAHPALAYRARRPDPDRAFQGYTLFTPMFGDGTVYLLDMGGEVVHTWRLPYRPGLYGYLLDDGRLFYSGKVMEDLERFEGWPRFKAGAALEVDWSSRVLWEVQHPDHHHDARRLRKGNVLLLCLRPVPDASRARIRGGVPDTETPAGIYGDSWWSGT